MTLTGKMTIGSKKIMGDQKVVHAINPHTNEVLDPPYAGANQEQLEEACALAHQAFASYRKTSSNQRADFLQAIGEEIMALGDALVERAMQETGLPQMRIEGERGRTVGQLNLFASNLRDGLTELPKIDTALPERTPLPRPDLRLSYLPLGPVAVFGASNFPLAFSVAGGDTASALAAGCPVIVKAHSAHPGTAELVASAIITAAKRCDMPEGVFSLLFGSGSLVGQGLVAHPNIKAVGFTGSRTGGLALMSTAQNRPEPIPVYAEMSSINPVIIMPGALGSDIGTLAAGFCTSLQMGAGQFCTNPGLVLAVDSSKLDEFVNQCAEIINSATSQTMLTPGIHAAYQNSVGALVENPDIAMVSEGEISGDHNQCTPYLFSTSADVFLQEKQAREEIFGSSSLVVRCKDSAQLLEVIDSLEGQLTGTIHMGSDDTTQDAQQVLDHLELRVGRVLFNGYPTGVEVSHAMVHGGPFPATSDSRTTSVGSNAIERFLRPVCYQNTPASLLPQSLRDEHSGMQLVNGKYQQS
ncbi:NADP-dependent fatty aldehyde dehydrogenase [Vibrio nigripulchritudo MADA3029]|uniref:aldehyde dehydrogenase (NADP(+)) n=1 Tax=Vibrio nigripulchritudo TaxID=28173 RepID=UPI0003B18E06|nr:aldehyde dehydrogenase (NADP(+)) [Vibrio nigripulchritudo]CCN46378.1 NADP-dependent fatty aldehyde dehydrogenase [Vibrio nigripulchritudo MADA3020]CCN53448.1 NADP-dependent fatty aldehyde dehydrogenase [Vibrio nigripulchritudo MADA3021]CCN58401.1 NADP-dependent fatty aldehyde dehydrogenase [Vibrio nigripulchritudo MADA3029]